MEISSRLYTYIFFLFINLKSKSNRRYETVKAKSLKKRVSILAENLVNEIEQKKIYFQFPIAYAAQ